MAELALGILGVVPLIGGAIKAYKQVNGKLKAFRHCSKEAKKIQKVLRIQQQVFSNECRLWLRFAIEDDEIVSEMASDPEHENWGDASLESCLRTRLKNNYEPWVEIIQDITGYVEELENGIRKFVIEKENKSTEGRLKKTLKRTQDGVKMAFSASDFDILIGELRSSNDDLKGLREQISELHKPTKRHSKDAKAVKQGEWASLIRIRRASKALHDALVRTWNCGQPGHMGHAVKLFVETHRVNGEIQMNLAIVCRSHTRDRVQSTLVQLEVHSQNLQWIEPPRLPGQLSAPVDCNAQSSKRIKVVRFAETTMQIPLRGRPDPESGPPADVRLEGSFDLGLSRDICRELTQQLEANCLGYLDVQSDEAFRHSFYPANKNFCGKTHPSYSDHKSVTMDEVLDESLGGSFSTIDRLKLARSLVSAVLKFHSTPWLSDFWRLRDLAFFRGGQDEEVSEALRSLHVGVEVAQKQFDLMDDVQDSSGMQNLSRVTEDEQLYCGIGNLTLHSLGVALLQIDRWARVEPDDVLAVRKMALRSSSLGPRYQEITQKCLRCDFGYGSDLTKPRLQEAVYENVVEVLETMISSLDLTED
ncbi:hypothetical protein CI238_01981 [Colletotrichum incanum]|uniref:DUF7580 domain-containing protein n=1 Tax=Colletotrichum incanum TaxID=1573173 RepID=A0A167CS13_COLIC|nr:hypothetical protein CI238_01981 [Colletotrichum incanum]